MEYLLKSIQQTIVPITTKKEKSEKNLILEANNFIFKELRIAKGRGQYVPIKDKTATINYLADIHALQIKRAIGDYRTDYKSKRDSRMNLKETKEFILNTPGWI